MVRHGPGPGERQIRPSAIRSQLGSNLVQSITKRGSNQRKEMAIGKAIRFTNIHRHPRPQRQRHNQRVNLLTSFANSLPLKGATQQCLGLLN
jgi:hypothetical protein